MVASTIKKYHPKVSTLISLCECNYFLLMRLIADKNNVGEQRYFSTNNNLSYRIDILEVTRYTNVIEIRQISQFGTDEVDSDAEPSNAISSSLLSNVLTPKMQIRMYHDASLAEVISTQGMRQIKPRYDYPNDQMHLPDEKQQMNQFLKEWLQICLQLGCSRIDSNK